MKTEDLLLIKGGIIKNNIQMYEMKCETTKRKIHFKEMTKSHFL